MEIEQRIYNGDRAREVLENEAFQWAFDELKKELTKSWEMSPARDQEGREKLYQLLKLADKLKVNLTTSLETGKQARLDLDYQESLAQKAKRVLGIA